MKKEELFSGLSKKYIPIDEEGERLPNETKNIQMSVKQAINEVSESCKNMFNIVATQDIGNCSAKADIIVDGVVVAEKVPATYLIFLEKQLTDLATFTSSFPTLDPSENWKWKEDAQFYVSEPKETIRTKKVNKVLVKYEATDKHPAQTEVYPEDIQIGTYTTIKYSGCISKKEKDEILERIRVLDKAVKIAREEANNSVVEMSDLGDKILGHIFK
jgi:archaellum component FlaF (FlaF/FlaG flagellin family)